MKNFTVGLALFDYVPVAAFGAAGIIGGLAMGSPLFILGGALSFFAGLLKATWKLILALTGKDLKAMNRPFVPMQAAGFALMLAAGIVKIFRTGPAAAAAALFSLPQLIFFVLWFALMGLMVWYKKNRFRRRDAKSNWIAEIINTLAQCSFLLFVVFAAKG